MSEALIYTALRTPVGAVGGTLSSVRPDDLAAHAVKAVVERSGVDPAKIDDVIFGCTNGAGEDNRNVARMAVLLAGLPTSVPGMTVNRLCGSGLQAVACASQAIAANDGQVFVVGGVESMSRAPFVMLKSDRAFDRRTPQIADTTVGWRFVNKRMDKRWTVSLGETAEIVAERYGIARQAQDEFALQSQQRAAAAIAEGRFAEEIIAVEIPQRKGDPIAFTVDEHPRAVTLEKLSKLQPVFRQGGTITAGSASGINDGAAALIVAAEGALSQRPLARVIGTAVAGVDPDVMGIGPVPATNKLLKRLGMTIDQIDLIELNEAFAAQSLACIKELKLDVGKVNVNGGAIALGHPLGCTGAKILVSLTHELRRRKARFGLATMCIGVGQGIAMVIENLER
ncbi:MAG: acetyl-CoA C-acyltransferase [Deltaproteobacteria bacterium]|nr:acetyl-CoA C-acyltransferase [Deltaproteobacteria bacterium]